MNVYAPEVFPFRPAQSARVIEMQAGEGAGKEPGGTTVTKQSSLTNKPLEAKSQAHPCTRSCKSQGNRITRKNN